MSRIGKEPITIPESVQVQVQEQKAFIKGVKGTQELEIPKEIQVSLEGPRIIVLPVVQTRKAKALWGLTRTLLQNAVLGVTEGYKKELELVGIGFKVEAKNHILVLSVGYSHKVEYQIPEEVNISVEKNVIAIDGLNKQKVGQTAAEIRSIKKPEPYKGKGIRYLGEQIKLKPGKAGKAVG